MDVKHAATLQGYLAAVVFAGLFGPVALGANGGDTSPSMLVVTASDSGEELQQPEAVAASDIVICSSDDSDDTAVSSDLHRLPDPDQPQLNKLPPAQGELTVVANSQRKGLLSALMPEPSKKSASADITIADSESIADAEEIAEADDSIAAKDNAQATKPSQPQKTSWGKLFASGGPRRPSPAAGIQPRQHAMRYEQAPPQMQLEYADEESTAAPWQTAGRPAPQPAAAVSELPEDPAADLLVRAYELSLNASAEVEYSQIVRWCAEAMRHDPQPESRQFGIELSAWALNRRGEHRNEDGQRDLAMADFQAALDLDPAHWRALHNRAVTRAQTGEFAEAFDDVCQVIQLNPDFAKAYSNRATLYVQAGDYDAALNDYSEALRVDPTLLTALMGRGRVCHMAGRHDEALAAFDAAATLEPANAEIVCSRGDLLADLGRYGEALADYAKAIDLDREFEHAYRNGAWLLATCPDEEIRDVQGALTGAQAALNCGYGKRHAALDTLAAAQANAGQFEVAVATVEQAIAVAPSEAQAAYVSRKQLYQSGQPFRTQPLGEVKIAGFVEPNEAQ